MAINACSITLKGDKLLINIIFYWSVTLKKRINKLIVLSIFSILTCSIYYFDLIAIISTVARGDLTKIVQIITQAGPAAVLISISLNILISLLGVIPSVFITAANVLVFGLYKGFMISWLSEVIGALVAILFYRWGIKSVAHISSEQWQLFKTIDALPTSKQIYFLAVLRTAPFIPSGIINLLSALSTITLYVFFVATAIGKFPALMLEVAFSYNLVYFSQKSINLLITGVVAAVLYWGIKKELNRLKSQHK